MLKRKWFYKALDLDGLNRLLAGHDDKSAAAVCTFAFSWGEHGNTDVDNNISSGNNEIYEPEVFMFQARNEGRIVPARGEHGFAYDPIFEFEGKTYSELEPDIKVCHSFLLR